MNPFTAIGDAISGIVQCVSDVTTAVFSSLSGLVNGLEYVDTTIVNMKNLDIEAVQGGASLPVVQAVAAVKYLMPTDLFYFLYLFILIGICLSIYKIVAYMLTVLFNKIIPDSGGFSASSILSGFANKFRW